MASLVVRAVSFLEVGLEVFRFHFRPRSSGDGVKSESVLVSRAARNWRPPVRRSRRHRPPPFGLPCRTRPFLRGPLLPGQPRFPFPAVACFPAPKGLRLAELGTCGERPPGEACGTLGRDPCSRPFPVCVRLFLFTYMNYIKRKLFIMKNTWSIKKTAHRLGRFFYMKGALLLRIISEHQLG